MRAHDKSSRTTSERKQTPRRSAVDPHGLLALQRSIGNQAVTALLRAEKEPHVHGEGCGHGQPVQRSTISDVLRSPGRSLDRGLRKEMEARLGADFSDVRLHDDATAQTSAAEIGAGAYTSGSHVVTGTPGIDKHTLAHELTHVIQQRSGPVSGTDNGSGLKVSDPSDRFEREAEANARRVMAGPVPRTTVDEPAKEAEAGEHIQRVSSFGFSETDSMTTQQWTNSGQSTFLSLHYMVGTELVDLGRTQSNTSATYGNEHAEDVALRIIRTNLGMFAADQDNHLVLQVSKSPCTSTPRQELPTTSTKQFGCAEELIELVNNGLQDDAGTTYQFRLDVICRGLYCPTSPGFTQQQVLDASQAAVGAMLATGRIQVSGDERPASAASRYEVQ
jgi:Domain of unknown function (DUF4157)